MRKRNHTSRRQSSPAKAPRCRRLFTESLEQRSLMAADLGLADGYVQLHGTDQNDVAEIYQQGDQVIVDYSQFDASGQLLESRQESYARGDVLGVFFQGDAGDDVFVNGTDLPMIALGGAGNDVLIGGSAGDVVSGGCGDDRISGGAGIDILLGGSGSNVLFDASGIETADPVNEPEPVEAPVAEVDEPVNVADEPLLVEESPPAEDSQPVDESPSAEDSSTEQGCPNDEAAGEVDNSSSDVTPPAEPPPPVDPPIEVEAIDVVPPVEETVVDEPVVRETAEGETVVDETTADETTVDDAPASDPLDCPLDDSSLPASEPVVVIAADSEPEPFVGPILVGAAIDDSGLADEAPPAESPLAEAAPAEATPTETPPTEVAPTAVEALPLEEASTPAAAEANSEQLSLGGNDILVGGAGADLLLGGEGDDGLFGDELPAELLAQLTLNQFSWFQGGQG